jgi:hypothetical protein
MVLQDYNSFSERCQSFQIVSKKYGMYVTIAKVIPSEQDISGICKKRFYVSVLLHFPPKEMCPPPIE